MENWEKRFDEIWKHITKDGLNKKSLEGRYIHDVSSNEDDESEYSYVDNTIKSFISSELELAKQEERERIESVKNYLYDIEIPPGDAKIDVNFDVKYYAMKMEDKLKAEFVASKLKYWLKLQVLYLEKGLKKQIASLHQNNEQGGK